MFREGGCNLGFGIEGGEGLTWVINRRGLELG